MIERVLLIQHIYVHNSKVLKEYKSIVHFFRMVFITWECVLDMYPLQREKKIQAIIDVHQKQFAKEVFCYIRFGNFVWHLVKKKTFKKNIHFHFNEVTFTLV